MEINDYLAHYAAFHAEFCPDAGIVEKQDKLNEEITEYVDAVYSGVRAEMISEAVDVMNTVIAYLVSEGVTDPLQAGYDKLRQTSEKYRHKDAYILHENGNFVPDEHPCTGCIYLGIAHNGTRGCMYKNTMVIKKCERYAEK